MLRSIPVTILTVTCALLSASPLRADEPAPATAAAGTHSLVQAALADAWLPQAPGGVHAPQAMTTAAQRRRGSSAGPSIGAVGLGVVAGLSDFEIGPSFRYWINERFGVQAHLGFSGGDDFFDDDVEYLRFEPTFIVAIGDFGSDAVNVRPYAGGGLRVVRTDIGDFSDTAVRPAGVGGVELGFRGAPRLKVSGELSVSTEDDLDDDFDFGDPPELGGVRFVALVHYFFD